MQTRRSPDPLVLDMMDIKKAYPNCSRNAMDKPLKLVGVPPKLRNILAKLDSLTSYQCRSAVGLSEAYSTLRSCREGCPAAPIKFNILHHVATMELRKKCDLLAHELRSQELRLPTWLRVRSRAQAEGRSDREQ